MIVGINGWSWSLKDKVNRIDGHWFGLLVDKWTNGNICSIGLYINDYTFGCTDYYNMDWSIDTEYSGIYYYGDEV